MKGSKEARLRAVAQRWAAQIRPPVIAVGVGNELRGDDAAGLVVCRALEKAQVCPVVYAGEVPESYIGAILAARPNTVIFCDACHLCAPPGSFSLLRDADLALQPSISTHRPPIRLLSEVLKSQGVGTVLVAAIQPRTAAWGGELSRSVQRGCLLLARALAIAIHRAKLRAAQQSETVSRSGGGPVP